MEAGRFSVLFVHGFLSSARTWSRFLHLLREDRELGEFAMHTFQYRSPVVSIHPLRRIPRLDDVADSLRTFLARDLADYSHLVLVGHSQGGLVIQRSLARALADGGDELSRIRLIVMYACPHAGSDLALRLRGRTWLWKHPQAQELDPLSRQVIEAQRIVLNRIVHSPDSTIEIVAYAGESDAVVTPASARSAFPSAGVLPGDHFSIIQPDSREHRSYKALKRDLLAVVTRVNTGPPPSPPAPPPLPRSHLPDRDGGRERPAAFRSIARHHRLVDKLLAVPGMSEPSFRQQLYELLPEQVQAQLPRHSSARTELVGVVMTLSEYEHLDTWNALVAALAALVPDHPAVADLAAIVSEPAE